MGVVLITGGGTGIGAAVARKAATAGHTAVIVGRRRAPLDDVATSSDSIHAFTADMSDPGEIETLVSEIVARFHRLDAVVANAGIMAQGSVADTDLGEWDSVMSVNLRGPMLLARASMPHLRNSRGSLVAIGSIAGLRVPAGASAYAVSKAALSMLVRTIAVDEGPHGVRANVISPGWVRTEMADEEMRAFGEPLGLDREEAYSEMSALVPLRRAAGPEEIASAVMWLIGEESGYVNGADLVVDGGTTLVDPGTVPFEFSVRPRN